MPMLFVSVQPCPGGGPPALLRRIEADLQHTGSLRYERVRLEELDPLYRGALAEDYRFDAPLAGGRVVRVSATALVLPRPNGVAWVLTMAGEPADWETIRPELLAAAQVLGQQSR